MGLLTGLDLAAPIDFESALGRLVLAIALGGLIGFEREIKDRPAGLRTHMLTSLAAATFTLLTLEYYQASLKSPGSYAGDPIRVIEAVTAGVAFLAAGSIIQSRGRVHGLTTGAGMWLAGSVGLCCGSGLYALAATTTALSLLILSTQTLVEKWGPNNAKPDSSSKTSKS